MINIKKIKVPDSYILLLGFIIFAAILTYILPAGVYNKIANTSNIDPTSFHFVKNTPVNLFKAIGAIPLGLAKGASIIFSVLLISGAFKVVNDTGALESAIDALAVRLKTNTILLIPIIMIVMSVLGYLSIIVNQTIVFIPIGLMIARKLKLDPVVGLSMMFVATYVGFMGSGMCPFTVVVAQKIAGLPILSGILFRTIVFLILIVVSIIYVMRYIRKIQADPTKSVLGTTNYDWAVDLSTDSNNSFTAGRKLILLSIFVTFGIYIYGALNYSWGMDQLSTLTIMLAIVSGIIARMTPKSIVKSFVQGLEMAVYSSVLIGVAMAIEVVLSQGNITSTIIHYASIPLDKVPSAISAVLMLVFNMVFNFFVPSGSGQAAVVIPILAPLGDVIGLSKQVIVSTYKYGDGITNFIIPTAGTTMGFIALARIPYEKWLKFMMPLAGLWFVIASGALIVGILIGF